MSFHVLIFIFLWTCLVSNLLGAGKLCISSPFDYKSNAMVTSENVPVYWMSLLRRTCPSEDDPWRLLGKKQQQITQSGESRWFFISFYLDSFLLKYRVLVVVLEYCWTDPWRDLWICLSCQYSILNRANYRLKTPSILELHGTLSSQDLK